MLIKRKVKEAPETEEEKKDKQYKKTRNVGLASLGTGATLGALRVISNSPELRDKIEKRDKRMLEVGAAGLSGIGAGLVGYAGIKRKNLRKKEREEKDDNNKKE